MLKMLTDAGIALVKKSLAWLLRHVGGLCLIACGIALGAWLF